MFNCRSWPARPSQHSVHDLRIGFNNFCCFLVLFIVRRICHAGEDSASFLKEPDFHVFPLANLYNNSVLRVCVQSLPRCDIFNFTDEILASKINHLYSGQDCNHKDNEDLLECVDDSSRSPLKKKSCIKQLDGHQDLNNLNGTNFSSRQNILDFSKPSTSRILDEQVVANKCERNLLKSSKTAQDSLKGGYFKIRSLSEGTPGNSLHGQISQCCEEKDQPPCKSQTKQVKST